MYYWEAKLYCFSWWIEDATTAWFTDHTRSSVVVLFNTCLCLRQSGMILWCIEHDDTVQLLYAATLLHKPYNTSSKDGHHSVPSWLRRRRRRILWCVTGQLSLLITESVCDVKQYHTHTRVTRCHLVSARVFTHSVQFRQSLQQKQVQKARKSGGKVKDNVNR